jgi:hypothetical protein
VLVACRPTTDSVLHTRATLLMLARELAAGRGSVADIGVVVLRDPRDADAAGQVAEALAVEGLPDCVIGTLETDPRADLLFTGALSDRARQRSALMRSAVSLTGVVHAQLHGQIAVTPVSDDGATGVQALVEVSV